ncbi:hypothetical protein RRG08_045773 [Elysia crispata]|uniref:Uncharacterized protein n=1 Tax=Elysia crispata TaxID=231223 RepID=A0AAE1B0T2_9GAST|nr:hypothetical protein RRG08_045773 [Elysia crispata]
MDNEFALIHELSSEIVKKNQSQQSLAKTRESLPVVDSSPPYAGKRSSRQSSRAPVTALVSRLSSDPWRSSSVAKTAAEGKETLVTDTLPALMAAGTSQTVGGSLWEGKVGNRHSASPNGGISGLSPAICQGKGGRGLLKPWAAANRREKLVTDTLPALTAASLDFLQPFVKEGGPGTSQTVGGS